MRKLLIAQTGSQIIKRFKAWWGQASDEVITRCVRVIVYVFLGQQLVNHHIDPILLVVLVGLAVYIELLFIFLSWQRRNTSLLLSIVRKQTRQILKLTLLMQAVRDAQDKKTVEKMVDDIIRDEFES